MSQAEAIKAFFDSLTDEAQLQRLIDEKREEDLYLEFKQKVRRDKPDLEEGDKSAFSQALSGFANADGGILIFGVETKRSQDETDVAHSLKPIKRPGVFCSRLQDSIFSTTQFFVEGVIVDVIEGSTKDEGYVKCYVPASDKPPHRAMLADREYWRRTVKGFSKMEHYELEDAFGRRLRPLLRLYATVISQVREHYKIDFFLLNEGRAVARHCGFICRFEREALAVHVTETSATTSSLKVENSRSASFYDPTAVFHPHGLFNHLGAATFSSPNPGPFPIRALWYAENMVPQNGFSYVLGDGNKVLLAPTPKPFSSPDW